MSNGRLDAYRQKFHEQLEMLVGHVFSLTTPAIARQLEMLYPKELRQAAAEAGFDILVPVNTAVTFLVIMQSNSIVERSPFSKVGKRLFSAEARMIYNAHRKMLNGSNGLEQFWDSSMLGAFTKQFHINVVFAFKNASAERMAQVRRLTGSNTDAAKQLSW